MMRYLATTIQFWLIAAAAVLSLSVQAQSLVVSSASGPVGGLATPVPVTVTLTNGTTAATAVIDIDARLTYNPVILTISAAGSCTVLTPGNILISRPDGSPIANGVICSLTAINIASGAPIGSTPLTLANGAGSGCTNAVGNTISCGYVSGAVSVSPAAGGVTYTVPPTTLTFATTAPGTNTSASVPVAAAAGNSAALQLSQCMITGANATDFSVTAPVGATTVAAGSTINVGLRFAPIGATPSSRSANLTCPTPNATSPNATSFTVALTAPVGIAGATRLEVGSATGQAGATAMPLPLTVTFTNGTTASTTVRDIDARLTYNPAILSIAVSGSCLILAPGNILISKPDNGTPIADGVICNLTTINIAAGAALGSTPLTIANGAGSGCTNAAGDETPCGYVSGTVMVSSNTAPTLTPATGVTRQQGSAASNSIIATISDAQSSPGSLTVTAPSVPAGLTVSSLVNAAGTVSANLAASCSASVGANSVGLSASDGSLSTAGNLSVNVTANAAPTLGSYPATRVVPASATSVTPSVAPSDNGNIATLTATAPGFTGTLSGNTTTGVITISNAGPGSLTPYVVTVIATDNCGLTSTRTFNLNVNFLADLSVLKTDGVSTYVSGSVLVYSIQLNNLGPDAAPNVVFTDTVPATLTGVTWSCASTGGGVCPQASGTGNINATVATLPANGRLSYTLQASLISPLPASVINTAQVNIAGLPIVDPVLNNQSATDIDLPENIFKDGFEQGSLVVGTAAGQAGATATPLPVAVTFTNSTTDATAVRDIDARLTYNPAVLSITAAGACAVLTPGNILISKPDNGTPIADGVICNLTTITIAAGTALGSTPLTLANGSGSGCTNAAGSTISCGYVSGAVTVTAN